jgi:predicted CoA-binding protein
MKSSFSNIHTIAIVGLSDKPERYSYKVGSYLQSQGFRIIPVNPLIFDVLGEKAYPDLQVVPTAIKIDVVDIFRKSALVMPHVEEAIKRGDVHTIWMQEGVSNKEAATLAQKHGLHVVMNMCMMTEYKKDCAERTK